MEKRNQVGLIVSGFVVILVGIIFATVIGDNISSNRDTWSKINETITLTSQAGQLASFPVISMSFFGNASNNTYLAGYANSIGSEINFTPSTGAIRVSSIKFPANGVVNVSYVYSHANYVADAPSRTLLSTTMIFWAILVVALVLLMMFKLWPDLFD